MLLREALSEILGKNVYAKWPLSAEHAVATALSLIGDNPKTEAERLLIDWWDRQVAAGRFPYAKTQNTRAKGAMAEAVVRSFEKDEPELVAKLRKMFHEAKAAKGQPQ